MNAWYEGDLSRVSPREDLGALHRAVLLGIEKEIDLGVFFVALGELDAVACAELVVGSRATRDERVVIAALGAVDALESVMAPSGLYARLLELAPTAAASVLKVASQRHPAAPWLVRFSGSHDKVPGTSVLNANIGGEGFVDACENCASAGLVKALVAVTIEHKTLVPMIALYRCGGQGSWAFAARALLDCEPGAPVAAWLAAVHGPDIGDLIDVLLASVENPQAIERLRTIRQGLVSPLDATEPSLSEN